MHAWQHGYGGGAHSGSYSHSQPACQKEDWATWTCTNCDTQNWLHYGKQKKNCGQCGLKRSYQQVLTGGAGVNNPGTGQSQSNTVKSKLDALVGELQSVAPRPHAAVEQTLPPVDRRGVNEEIKALVASLRALPEDPSCDPIRACIAAKISEQKQSIIRAKPIGAQVDACRALLSRCQHRRDQAFHAVTVAQQVMIDADKEVADAQADLSKLESELASSDEPNSLESMASSMTRVLTDMKAGGIVPTTLISEAEEQMKVLFMGINKIAGAVKEHANAQTPQPLTKAVNGLSPASKAAGAPESKARKTETGPPMEEGAGVPQQGLREAAPVHPTG